MGREGEPAVIRGFNPSKGQVSQQCPAHHSLSLQA